MEKRKNSELTDAGGVNNYLSKATSSKLFGDFEGFHSLEVEIYCLKTKAQMICSATAVNLIANRNPNTVLS